MGLAGVVEEQLGFYVGWDLVSAAVGLDEFLDEFDGIAAYFVLGLEPVVPA